MIHEKGITLSESERNRLRKNAMSQDRQIVLIFKERPTHAFTFHDIVKATNFNQDSAPSVQSVIWLGQVIWTSTKTNMGVSR
jgi:hypothetical protein